MSDKMRWTDPLSGQRLLAGTIPKNASDEAKQKAFDLINFELNLIYGSEVASSLAWDKGNGPRTIKSVG